MGDWIEAVDPTHQQPYWYSPSLNESTWERPALALHWTAQIDDAGHTYYYHVETGESRWEPPYALTRSGAFGGRVAEGRSVLVDEEDVAVDATQRSGAFGGRVAEDHSAFRGYRAEPRPDPEPEPEPAPATIERAAAAASSSATSRRRRQRRRSLVDAAHPHLNPTQLDHLDLDPSIRRTTKGKAFTKPKQRRRGRVLRLQRRALRIFGEISGDASRLRALLAESEGRKRDEDAEERARGTPRPSGGAAKL
ncbi:hypothetical protein JL720_6560 [Aureococcus anophagefferens]|nr:hypothetical protein JL720_6560 [Aureococcus anophagefferens]